MQLQPNKFNKARRPERQMPTMLATYVSQSNSILMIFKVYIITSRRYYCQPKFREMKNLAIVVRPWSVVFVCREVCESLCLSIRTLDLTIQQ